MLIVSQWSEVSPWKDWGIVDLKTQERGLPKM